MSSARHSACSNVSTLWMLSFINTITTWWELMLPLTLKAHCQSKTGSWSILDIYNRKVTHLAKCCPKKYCPWSKIFKKYCLWSKTKGLPYFLPHSPAWSHPEAIIMVLSLYVGQSSLLGWWWPALSPSVPGDHFEVIAYPSWPSVTHPASTLRLNWSDCSSCFTLPSVPSLTFPPPLAPLQGSLSSQIWVRLS